jgi:pilus assembly protein Flp/PilA
VKEVTDSDRREPAQPLGGLRIFAGREEKYKERNKMKSIVLRLWKDQEGQDLTEYALLLVLLSLAAVGSLSALATAINSVFSTASTNLT